MSGALIEINVTGTEVFELFQRLPRLANDSEPLLDEIGAYLDSDVTKRFLQGVTPEGQAWIPSQRALNENGKTLVDTTILMGSVTHNATDAELEHGLTEEYAAIHHFGGRAGRNKSVEIKARPIVGIAATQQARIDKISIRWMKSWFEQ